MAAEERSLARDIPPCAFCGDPAVSMAAVGPKAGVPMCADPQCYAAAERRHDAGSRRLEDARWEAEVEEHLGELLGGMSWAESQGLRTAEDEGPLDDADPTDPDVQAWLEEDL